MIRVIQEGEFNNLTELFVTAGNALIAAVGGYAGIIFGTFFRSGGKALNNSKTLTVEGFTNFLSEALEAIQLRGKAKPGDKTMLDALYPAFKAAQAGKELPFGQFIHVVAKEAKKGMENTADIEAETGRAKDFGKNALGYLDPGAITTFLIIDVMNLFINSIR